jgi:hypothetical protein
MRFIVLLLLFVHAVPLVQGADPRQTLLDEIERNKKLITEVKTLKNRGTVDPIGASAFIGNMEERNASLHRRNQMLGYTAISKHFAVHASTKVDADTYLEFSEKVLKTYSQHFPSLNFNPSNPAQIFLYPDRAEYLKYDGVHVMVLGHAISNRQKGYDLVKRNNTYLFEEVPISTAKWYRLSTYKQEKTDVFAHEVCHLLTYDMINPTQSDLSDLNPSRFLNEGLSEFFGAQHDPEVVQRRGMGLLTSEKDGSLKISAPPNFQELLGQDQYPKDSEKMSDFYSEATLFTKWLMELPEGPQLVRNLLLSKPAQMESQLRIHQRHHRVPDIGYAAYLPFREQLLNEIKGKLSKNEIAMLSGDKKISMMAGLKELKREAKKGDKVAQLEVGYLYFKGSKEVNQNYSHALKWFKMAADQGYDEAQYYLGRLYEGGFGVPKDAVEAFKWYQLATTQLHEEAKDHLDRLKDTLTAEQITEGKDRASKFTVQKPTPLNEEVEEERKKDGSSLLVPSEKKHP